MTQPRPAGPRGSGNYADVNVNGEQYQFIRGMVLRGVSANRIIEALSGTELAIRRQAALAVRREVLATAESSKVLGNTPFRFYPSEAAYTPVARNIGAAYRVWAVGIVENRQTGERRVIRANYAFDRRQTREQINAGILGIMNNALEAYESSVASEDIAYLAAESQG